MQAGIQQMAETLNGQWSKVTVAGKVSIRTRARIKIGGPWLGSWRKIYV